MKNSHINNTKQANVEINLKRSNKSQFKRLNTIILK